MVTDDGYRNLSSLRRRCGSSIELQASKRRPRVEVTDARRGNAAPRRAAGWAPEGGVVSVYVEIDPADRSEGWRIDLKNKLAGVDRGGGERVFARFPPDSPLPRGRTQVGFVELGGARREIWRGFQIASGETTVAQGDLPGSSR